MNETVTISKVEYERLKKNELMLMCLEGAGVDNWSGYSEAMELMDQEEAE